MAKIDFLILRGANLYAEDDAGEALNVHLTLDEVKLPGMKENFETFAPAASNGSIELTTNREPCEATFKLRGLAPGIMNLFNTPYGVRRKFTIFGALVNEYAVSAAERETQVTATLYGRLNADPSAYKSDAVGGVEYMIKSISKYSLVIGPNEVARFNIQLGGWIDAGGQQVRIANMLGLNG
jgi:phage tail tube protein FII